MDNCQALLIEPGIRQSDFSKALKGTACYTVAVVPVQTALALLRGFAGSQSRWDTFLAGSIVTTLPIAIVFFIFQRFFIEGVSCTGLKG